MNRLRRSGTMAAALALLLGVAACGSAAKKPSATSAPPESSSSSESSGPSSSSGSTSSAGEHAKGGTVTIANVAGQTWTCQFNPFNPAVNQQSTGFVYEPLIYVNILRNSEETPMLASSF